MTNTTDFADTKSLIKHKFKELVGQKPLSKVTVSEIISECNINRKTFYYYFDDIYDLLKQFLHEDAIGIFAGFDLQKDFERALLFVFDYIEDNDAFLKNVYFSVGRDELKRLFYGDFANIVNNIFEIKSQKNGITDNDFKNFAVKFYTEGIAATFADMIIDYPNTNKDKTVGYLSRIINDIFQQ